MATPQDPQAMAAMVDGIASKAMGVEAAQAQPAPEAKTSGKDSAEGQAAEKGSPETEGDKVSAEAIIYEVDFGDGKNRQLTPQQIKSTFERYSALNFKNAQYKPVMDVIEQYMRSNPNMTTKQMADTLQNLAKANESNPTMGNTDGEKSGDYDKTAALKSGDMDAMLSKWEEDNAASLPPGYKEMIASQGNGMQDIRAQLAQTQQMLQAVLAQSAGVADAAKQGMQGAQSQQINAVRQQIANNIDRVQQALGLPDDKANDFMVFAGERGFTMEDFVDPQLTIKVMQDFKNNMNSPEMERMRAIAQRRQAYTGSLGSTPSASPSAEAGSMSEGTTFDKLAQSAMSKRGMA
jgi:hypothetical protein